MLRMGAQMSDVTALVSGIAAVNGLRGGGGTAGACVVRTDGRVLTVVYDKRANACAAMRKALTFADPFQCRTHIPARLVLHTLAPRGWAVAGD